MPRRILIDATSAARGGGLTYAVNLVPELAQRLEAADRIRVLTRSDTIATALAELPRVETGLLPAYSWPAQLRHVHRELPEIARRWGATSLLCTTEAAPRSAPCPVVASFRNPNIFAPIRAEHWPIRQQLRLAVLRALAKRSARGCDAILFVSHDSAGWIGDVAGVPSDRRHVIHHGVSPAWLRDSSPVSSPLSRPYWLSVSSVYRYKNFVRLIDAWSALRAGTPEAPDLAIVGDAHDQQHWHDMQAARARSPYAPQIHLVGEVRYADIRPWYESADAFVFPSRLETFGHPMVEALAVGLPVLASDIPVFREIAGDAATYCDTTDTAALTRALVSFAANENTAADSEHRRARARDFTWGRSADQHLALLDRISARA